MLLELAMVGLERSPSTADGPYQWLAPHLADAHDVSDKVAYACAGVAALRGDLDVLRAVASSAIAPRLGKYAAVALGVIEGRYDEAGRIAEGCADFGREDHCGALALLFWFALRIGSPNNARARKLASFGARSGAPFQQTFRVAQAMEAGDAAGRHTRVKFPRESEPDGLTILWMMLHGTDPDDEFASFAMRDFAGGAEQLARAHATIGYAWLSEQLLLASWSLYSKTPNWLRSRVSHRPKEPKGTRFPALANARSARPEWEAKLDRLAELAGGTPERATEAPASAEQILWRVTEHGLVEPYLQKRSGASWTAGRKLAIKHLLRGSEQLTRLPPEDTRVAEHAREDHRMSYGYPLVECSMSPSAWLALVGHPRVHLHGSEAPIRVTMGSLKLRVRTEGGDTVVSLDPNDLSEGISVRKIGGELLVFHVLPRTKPLLSTVGRADLRIPAEGRERLLALLERLAPVVPIESSEATNAKRAPADATPRMRLVPGSSGLEVTLLVRPFGASGPLLAPGSGAPALIQHIGGETVQVERDLAHEAKSAAELVAALPALVDCDTGPNSW
ncbi:MAG: hypothetical protein JNK04_07025, partial [Myxococcales bacterium]|nr:hypothetical protein [Myxococcales bacterium]